jgi:hypothetical protein
VICRRLQDATVVHATFSVMVPLKAHLRKARRWRPCSATGISSVSDVYLGEERAP